MKRKTLLVHWLTFTITLLVFDSHIVEASVIRLVRSSSDVQSDIIVDTRPLSSCRQNTLSGAICLPVEDIVAPQRRLANWSGILWLLGTAGLTGDEHVLVIGEKPDRRNLLAGILTLAGQQQISIAESPASELLSATEQTVTGTLRSTTRINVYTAQMRSDMILLSNELQAAIQGDTVILDGRTEAEYFGSSIRTVRGGHIPGAIHSPHAEWISVEYKPRLQSTDPIIYSHDALEGLAYFTTLVAAGLNPRLYINGWVEWAANGHLPVDSVSYHTDKSARVSVEGTPVNTTPEGHKAGSAGISIDGISLLIGSAVGLLLVAAGFFGGKYYTSGNA